MSSPHPLLLYPVLRKIVSHLTFPDTVSIRQVCSEWKIEADHNLQNKVAIKIFTQHQLKQFIHDISPKDISIASHYHIQGINLNTSEANTFFTTFGTRIKSLNLKFCDWKSSSLRNFIFKHLPNLVKLEVSTKKYCGNYLEPLLPMSFFPFYPKSVVSLSCLKELRIRGDFSNRTDLFYDMLKSCSNNLEIIHLSKFDSATEDDLFSVWFLEIVFSCEFPKLSSLEVECILIQPQVDSLTKKSYSLLRRLSFHLELDTIDNDSIEQILRHFPFLESVEFGIEKNVPHSLIQSIILNKHSPQWIVGTGSSKIVFQKHLHVLES